MKLVLITTKFQFNLFKKIEKNTNESFLIINIYSLNLDKDIKSIDLGFSEVKLKNIIKIKHHILAISNLCNTFTESISSIYFFSEKDIYTQYFLYLFRRKKNIKYIYCEEGLGSYVCPKNFDKVKKLYYPLISKLLLGFPYQFYRTLGTYPTIDIHYSRMPKFLPNKKNKVSYYKIQDKHNNKFVHKNTNKILILTSPIIHNVRYIWELCQIISKNGFRPVIKVHPREKENKYYGLDQFIINEVDNSEELQYGEYKYIVNFFSSSLIDIINNKYPIENIFTLKKGKTKVEISFINKLNIYYSFQKMKGGIEKRILNDSNK